MLYDPKWNSKTTTQEPWRNLMLHAASIMDKCGLAKRALAAEDGSVCFRGALLAAIGRGSGANLNRIYFETVSYSLFREADKQMKAYVGMDPAIWNNKPERTKDEVVSAMRAVACSKA